MIADHASVKDRTVDAAVRRLEAAGFLHVERSKGRRSNRYYARLPATANELRGSEWATAQPPTFNREAHASNGEPASPEVGPRGPKREIEDFCGLCGGKRVLVDDIYCKPCFQILHEGVSGA